MPRFAANLTMMFNEVPFLQRFGAAAAAGFKAVEFLFPYEYPADVVAHELEKHGLVPALFNLPPGDWAAGERGLAALAERRIDFAAALDTARPYVVATGVKRVHMMAGIADPLSTTAQAAYVKSVAEAAAFGAELGVDIVLEPINPRDMPGYFLHDFGWTETLIGQMSLANVKLQFDIYHRQIIHGDVTRGLERLIPLIGHVQIAAVPDRHEPGTGELDDFKILRLLDSLGYDGYVGCEYRPAADTLSGLDWMKHFAGQA